jgi:hypothetical protein
VGTRAEIEPFLRTGDPAMKQRQAQAELIQTLYAVGDILCLFGAQRCECGVDKINQHLQVNPLTKRPFWQISDCPMLTRVEAATLGLLCKR